MTKAKGGNDGSHCFMQQPAHTSLNTPQGSTPALVQKEAVPPTINAPTAAQGSGLNGSSSWGSMEYSPAPVRDDGFPPLVNDAPKLSKKARAKANAKARKDAVNAAVPGYAPPASDPNNSTIPLSCIALSWLRTTTAAMTHQHQHTQEFRKVAAKVQNHSPSGPAKGHSSTPPGVTEITVIRRGSTLSTDAEAAF